MYSFVILVGLDSSLGADELTEYVATAPVVHMGIAPHGRAVSILEDVHKERVTRS